MYTDQLLSQIVTRFRAKHGYDSLDIRAALFDMDGTLYDSMPCHADAWKQMCRENGIEADRDEFFLFEGRTGADTINILFDRQWGHPATDRQIHDLYARKSELFRAMQPVPLMPGAASLTRQCLEAGLRCVLVTGSGQRSLIDKLSRDFPSVFEPEMMITAHDVTHGKPHPEPYLRALERAGVSANQAIVFENAPLGVQAGVRAGIFTVAVTTGPIPVEDMEAAGADIIFNSMAECDKTFARLLYYMNA